MTLKFFEKNPAKVNEVDIALQKFFDSFYIKAMRQYQRRIIWQDWLEHLRENVKKLPEPTRANEKKIICAIQSLFGPQKYEFLFTKHKKFKQPTEQIHVKKSLWSFVTNNPTENISAILQDIQKDIESAKTASEQWETHLLKNFSRGSMLSCFMKRTLVTEQPTFVFIRDEYAKLAHANAKNGFLKRPSDNKIHFAKNFTGFLALVLESGICYQTNTCLLLLKPLLLNIPLLSIFKHKKLVKYAEYEFVLLEMLGNMASLLNISLFLAAPLLSETLTPAFFVHMSSMFLLMMLCNAFSKKIIGSIYKQGTDKERLEQEQQHSMIIPDLLNQIMLFVTFLWVAPFLSKYLENIMGYFFALMYPESAKTLLFDTNHCQQNLQACCHIAYNTLDLKPGSALQDVRIQGKALRFQFHPDRNKHTDTQEQFKQIGAAIEIIEKGFCP
ncbi:MAG: hypothetical protein Q8R79_05810 [Legionellaceae bacterium]|nr:hypothetical protein [Legionellaceae bacterium]